MKAAALYPYNLPTQTYSAGASQTQTLRDLPKQYLGKLAHVSKFVLSAVITPTFTTAPTTVGHNNLLSRFDFYDGSVLRFQGGLNHLRAKEKMQTGRIRLADSTTAPASTNSRVFKRVLHAGPPQFNGSPDDHLIPTGYLENGEFRLQWGALTDISADTTAMTGSLRIVAWLALLNEIRIPPLSTFTNQATTAGDVNLAGRAAYESVSITTGSTFTAWTAGQIGNVSLDLGQGQIIPSIKINDLTASMHDDFNSGEVGAVSCEPEYVTYDTNYSIVNRGANPATALATSSNDIAPVLWSPYGTNLNNCPVAESVARLKWDGSQGTGTILVSRFLPQTPNVVASAVGKAVGRLTLKATQPQLNTPGGRAYQGSLTEFMPWKIHVR